MTCLLWAFAPSARARAAQPPRDCTALAALQSALGDEATAATALCEGDTADAGAKLARILSRSLVEQAPLWQSALLLELLRPGAQLSSQRTPQLKNLPEASKAKACSAIAVGFEEDAARRRRGELGGLPLTDAALADPRCKQLLGAPVAPMEGTPAPPVDITSPDRVFLVVPGAGGDSIAMAVWPQPSDRINHEPYVEALDISIGVGGIAYFLASVPRGARVVVRQVSEGIGRAPIVFARDMVRHLAYVNLAEAQPSGCVEVEVMGGDLVTLLDGQVVPSVSGEGENRRHWGRYFVPRVNHGLVVTNRQGVVRADVTILETELQEGSCARRSLDLRASNVSALIVGMDDSCTDQGVVRDVVRSYAYDALSKLVSQRDSIEGTSGKLIDFEGWATALTAVGGLDGSIGTMGQAPVGASRARLDSMDSLRSAAGELMRQGFREAFVSHLSCSAASAAQSYTFVVRHLQLKHLQNVDRSNLKGIELGEVLHTQQETVTQLSDLRDLVQVALARTFNVPYARLVTDPYDSKPDQLVEVGWRGKPPAALTLRVYGFPEADKAAAVCARVSEQRRLSVATAYDASPPASARLRWEKVLEPTFREASAARSDAAELEGAARAGQERLPTQSWSQSVTMPLRQGRTYLVRLDGPGDKVITSSCITTANAPTRWWALFDVLVSVGSRPELSQQSGTSFNVLAGVSLAPSVPFSLALVAGYSTSFRNAETPPSWNDSLDTLGYSSDGQLKMAWERRSLLIGFAPELRWPLLCTFDFLSPSARCNEYHRHVSLLLRSLLLVDAGVLSTDDVPAGLRDFLGGRSHGASIVDVDLDAGLQAGVDVRIRRDVYLSFAYDLWWAGLDDAFLHRRQLITYDNRWMQGGSIGVVYEP